MSVRLLFEVQSITTLKNWNGPRGQTIGSVKLSPRYPDEKDPSYSEVKSFYEATPGGSIEFATINHDALAQFKIGDLFYVTLEHRPEPT